MITYEIAIPSGIRLQLATILPISSRGAIAHANSEIARGSQMRIDKVIG